MCFGALWRLILVELFCRWCRALFPHLEESTILERFMSVVSSRCPCIRELRFFSLKWSHFGISLSFDHLFEFFICFFSLSLFAELVTMCVVNALIKGRFRMERLRTSGWSLPGAMSDW
jgi:hypothetical protein